jgi:Mg2+ and Co2+ transporter CorA
MESKDTDKIMIITVKIERGDEAAGDTKVGLIFAELDNLAVALSDSGVDDIKKLFDAVFEYIIRNRRIVEFSLEESENDLFYQVSVDIIDQLNSEIKESEDNFEKIWALVVDEDKTELIELQTEV